MNHPILTAESLRDGPAALNGKLVTIVGILTVGDEFAFVEIENAGQATKLPIRDRALRGKLLNAVPCYVGCEYLYRDPVRLSGTLREADGTLEIERVHSGSLKRDGQDLAF